MASSDTHLEMALVEFNKRVDKLEDDGPSADLVDVLVKRARVLAALDFKTSARQDLDDALEMIADVQSDGGIVPADVCFRTYVALAFSCCEDDDDAVRDYLTRASTYLGALQDPVSAARSCVECASDLLDLGDVELAHRYVDVVLAQGDSDDVGRRNILLNGLFLKAECYSSQDMNRNAIPFLVQAVGVGADLYEAGAVKDVMSLVLSYVYLADDLISVGRRDDARLNLDAVSAILDDKPVIASMDPEVLGDLHGQIGKDYVEIGEMEQAERHLLRQAAVSLSGEDGVLREAIERRMDGDE